MILNNVTIKNYRQYRDVKIDFAKEEGKHFTIIKGNNGTGKTTLLNALSWCLYGTEIHDYGDEASMSICNNKSANLASNGENIPVSVCMEFLDDGEFLAFNRETAYRKVQGDLIPNPRLSKFEVIRKNGPNIEVREDDFYTIERKIPKEIEDYFFFDGARLSEYFQTNKNMQIKDAVFDLSQLNLFEEVSKNLIKVKDNYISKRKKLLPKIGSAQEKISMYEKKIEESELSLDKSNKTIKDLEESIKDIDNKLISKKSGSVEEDVRRNRMLDNKIKSNNSELNQEQAKYKKHVLTKYSYVLSYNSFINFLELGEESREKGFIPPKYKKSFIQDLLDSGKCICGNDISINNEFRKELEKLLNETNPLTDNAEEITVALNYIKEVIIKYIKNFKKESLELHKKIKVLKDEKEKLINEKREVSARLDANPIEEIQVLKRQRDKFSIEKDNHNRNIANRKSEIERYKKSLGEQRKLLNNELSIQTEVDEYGKKIAFCEDKSEAAEKLFLNLKEDMRIKIQNLTKDKFIKVQWKENEFIDIRINENYEVFIRNRLGAEERPGDLSDGEKLCLGLCFMSALHNISGFDLPIIMDTPLGIVGTDMRKNIAEFLPEFVEDKQTVLLVTDTEYTDEFRDVLYRAVGKEYEINWDNSENGKESKVVLL